MIAQYILCSFVAVAVASPAAPAALGEIFIFHHRFWSNKIPVPRQFGLGSFGSFSSVAKPATVKDVQPKLDKSAKRHIIQWGPYTLHPAGTERTGFHLDANGDSFNGQLEGICKDCMFLSGSTYVTYENGTQADVSTGVYNHHVAVFDVGKAGKTPISCGFADGNMNGGTFGMGPSGSGRLLTILSGLLGGWAKGNSIAARELQKRQFGGISQLFGSGDDGMQRVYASRDPSLKTGFYLGKTDPLYHTTELVNYRNVSQTVYITADIEFIPGKPDGYIDASMGAMSATGCMGVGYGGSFFLVRHFLI
jgi:hypothetical protein